MAEEQRSVAVAGAGAVGSYFGGMLARAGVPVTLIGRTAHMDAIARNGLRFEGLRVRERIPIASSTAIESVRSADLVLFCVKTADTETAAREIEPHLLPGATVLSFQNGVDNVERIHRATGLHAIPVAVYVAVAVSAPGEITHTGRGDLVMGYRAGWPRRPELAGIARLFESAGIPCRISENIEAELWTKMAMNCAYNAISALGRERYGRILEFAPARDLMRRAIIETTAVARAEGVDLPDDDLVEAAMKLGEAMRDATSSMAQDLARGRRTEIDSLNGYVARRGAELGVPAPVNEMLATLIGLLERSTIGRW